MTKCAVINCKNNTATTRKDDGVTYHRFPQNYVMREKWRKIIARNRNNELYKPTETSIVCSEHFLESELYDTKKGFRRLKRTAYPHIQKTDAKPEKPECVKKAQKILLPIVTVNIPTHSNDSMEECNVKNDKDLELAKKTADREEECSISGISSVVDTPHTKHLKKELKKCHSRINMKNRQIDNMKKQIKRLLKKNQCLKSVIQDMKKLI